MIFQRRNQYRLLEDQKSRFCNVIRLLKEESRTEMQRVGYS
jgi:hypothetical protein